MRKMVCAFLKVIDLTFNTSRNARPHKAPSSSRVLWFSPEEKMPAMPYGWQTKPMSEAGSMAAKRTEGVGILAKRNTIRTWLDVLTIVRTPLLPAHPRHLPRGGRLFRWVLTGQQQCLTERYCYSILKGKHRKPCRNQTSCTLYYTKSRCFCQPCPSQR